MWKPVLARLGYATLSALVASSFFAGCGSKTGDSPPDDTGQGGGASAGGNGAATATSTGSISSVTTGGSSICATVDGSSGGAGVGTPGCAATCATPAGNPQEFSTVEEVYAAMEGRWQTCPGAGNNFPTAPADMIGVEYGPASSAPTPIGGTVGGNMYYLVQGLSGPCRGAGFAYQLTYDVSPEGPGVFQLNMHPTPNSGFAGFFRYSPCPRKFEIGVEHPSAILVPFD
jgi:hypothetical protein